MKEKDCFGVLNRVFPLDKDGLRQVPSDCQECAARVSCLREALQSGEGIRMREEMVDRAATSGMMGRWERWSRKKELNRLKKEGRKKSK